MSKYQLRNRIYGREEINNKTWKRINTQFPNNQLKQFVGRSSSSEETING